MTHLNGQITYNDKTTDSRFNRFVEEKIKGWIQQNFSMEDENSSFHVAFFDESSIGEVSCLLEVTVNNDHWRSWEMADNARVALSRSIDQLAIESNMHH